MKQKQKNAADSRQHRRRPQGMSQQQGQKYKQIFCPLMHPESFR